MNSWRAFLKIIIFICLVFTAGCIKQNPEPTSTPIPTENKNAATPINISTPVQIVKEKPDESDFVLDPSKLGFLEVKCDDGVDIDGELTNYSLHLSTPWNDSEGYFKKQMVFGKLNQRSMDARNQVYPHPDVGTPVVGTYRIEDGQTCVLGWSYDDGFFGFVINIDELLNDEDRTTRFEIVSQVIDLNNAKIHKLLFNTFFDIPQSNSSDLDDNGNSRESNCPTGYIPDGTGGCTKGGNP